MEKWFAIKAWNAQTGYGFGTPDEAATYCDLLNANRDVNHYYAEEIPEEDCAGLNSGDDTDGFRLDLAIDTLRENAEYAAAEQARHDAHFGITR